MKRNDIGYTDRNDASSLGCFECKGFYRYTTAFPSIGMLLVLSRFLESQVLFVVVRLEQGSAQRARRRMRRVEPLQMMQSEKRNKR
jgi:hypothetical protein